MFRENGSEKSTQIGQFFAKGVEGLEESFCQFKESGWGWKVMEVR